MEKIKIKGRIIGFKKDRVFVIFRSGTRIAVFDEEELIRSIQKSYKIGDIIELFVGTDSIILNPKIIEKPSSLVEKDGILYI